MTINPPEIDAPASSGYAPAVRAGDFIFVAGMMATSGKGRNECIPPEARPVPGYLWRGKQIKLETEYIIKHRLGQHCEQAVHPLAISLRLRYICET